MLGDGSGTETSGRRTNVAKAKGRRTAGDEPRTVPGVLRLKLGACLNAPTRRLHEDLMEVARKLNRARNAMARAWQRWHEDNPGNGDILFPDAEPCRHSSGDPTKPVTLGTWLYHAGRRECPELAACVMTQASQEIMGHLTAEMPYNHEGTARYRWQAVLRHEVNLETARGLVIPWDKAAAGLASDGLVYAINGAKRPGVVGELMKRSKSASVAAVPIWGTEADREQRTLYVRIATGPMGAGNRRNLRNLLIGAAGWQIGNSKLVFKPSNPGSRSRRRDGGEGEWFLHLSYMLPADTPLERSREARLTVAPSEEESPFFVCCQDHPGGWKVGHGKLLRGTFGRLNQRRDNMRQDYCTTSHGRRGHGRERFFGPITGTTIQVRHLVNRVACQAAAEAVAYCRRNNCGVLRYMEPPPGAARDRSWFASAPKDQCRVQWDWTLFGDRLAHICKRRGVELLVGEDKPAKPRKAARPRKAKAT